MPNRLPSSVLSATTARSALRSRKMPASILAIVLPEPRTMRPRMVTSGADTRITWPAPPPSTIAPPSPSRVSGLVTVTGPACVPGPRRRISPAAALSSARRRFSPPAGTSSVAAGAPDARETPAASTPAASSLRVVRPRRVTASDRVWLDDHPPRHLHVEGMAEPLAVIPVHAGPVGSEGDRRGLLGRDLHRDPVADQREAVCQVLDVVHVGDDDGDLVTLLHRELVEAVGRCVRVHVDAHLVAVADHVGGFLEVHLVLGRLLADVLPRRVVALVHHDRIHLGAVHDADVVRLGEARPVVHDLHLVAGDVDELIVLRMQRPDQQKPVL